MATVLIVEDEDQVRVLAESYLREQGHQTVSAANAEEALAVFEVVERIDVLFTDINLRGEVHAGLEAAKLARERQPDLAVLYTTGQAVTDGLRVLKTLNTERRRARRIRKAQARLDVTPMSALLTNEDSAAVLTPQAEIS